MDEGAKRGALRMVPYGMYILTARSEVREPCFAAATVTWLTQCSFSPPLVAVSLRLDSSVHQCLEETECFALHIVGAEQLEMAQAFFKPTVVEGERLSGYRFERGEVTGCPLLLDAPACWENRVVEAVRRGDHTLFVGEVVDAKVRDEAIAILCRDHRLHYAG